MPPTPDASLNAYTCLYCFAHQSGPLVTPAQGVRHKEEGGSLLFFTALWFDRHVPSPTSALSSILILFSREKKRRSLTYHSAAGIEPGTCCTHKRTAPDLTWSKLDHLYCSTQSRCSTSCTMGFFGNRTFRVPIFPTCTAETSRWNHIVVTCTVMDISYKVQWRSVGSMDTGAGPWLCAVC